MSENWRDLVIVLAIIGAFFTGVQTSCKNQQAKELKVLEMCQKAGGYIGPFNDCRVGQPLPAERLQLK